MMLLSVAAPLVGCGHPPMPPSAANDRLGGALPTFARPALDGRKVDIAERGKITVVKFFAKYCEPCKKTLPAAEAMHRNTPDVRVIGISEDEYRADAEAMVKTFRLTFPVVLDRGNVLAGRYRVNELPAVFVADANGTVRWVGPPEATEGDIEAAVKAVRAGTRP